MTKVHAAESLRGLACLAVVFSHLSLTFFPQLHHFFDSALPQFAWADWIFHSPFAFWYSGDAAVFVFFVLSGYVLSMTSLRTQHPAQKLKQSLIKRYPRLAIPAILSSVIACTVYFLPIDFQQSSEWIQGFAIDHPNILDALYSGAIGSFIFGEGKYNPVLWTMQVELFGSIVIYLGCFLHQHAWLKILFFVASVVSASFLLGSVYGILSFVIGHYLFLYGKKISVWFSLPVFLIGLYACGVHLDSHSYAVFQRLFEEQTYNVLNFIGGVLVVWSVVSSDQLSTWLDQSVLLWLGKISFSIYLLHFSVLYGIGIPFYTLLLHHHVSFLAAASAAIILVLLLSCCFAQLYTQSIDRFAINFSNRLIKANRKA